MTATTTPQKGSGTTLWIYTGQDMARLSVVSDDDWQRLGKVKDIQPGELQAETDEDNYIDDDDADWKRNAQGIKSVSDSTFTLAWLPGDPGQQAVLAAFDDGRVMAYRLKYPNGVIDIFYGFVSALGKSVSQNETITRTIRFTHSGKPTLAEVGSLPKNATSMEG
ncbi:phage tail tube protein [Edwardsiella tarda]|uniref:phage tail tube protein n=1 Tax=Edwardsiella tarda TaxID=636 RepID=UPI00083A4E0B|nr:phage tail tube protein [Edwardsiella tarda]